MAAKAIAGFKEHQKDGAVTDASLSGFP